MIALDARLRRRGFTLAVAFESESRVTGVFGPSGAGKTTLINLIAGLERPDRGSISLDGRTLFDGDAAIDVPTHRRGVGVVFQEHRLFPHYSVRGNLLYGARARKGRLASIVELLEIGPLLRRRVGQLSGGERQRVGLGRALLSDPRLLLLDEPLASLDQRLRRQILPYLRRIRDELTVPIVYVSHDLVEMLQLTDELLILEGGRVAGHGRYAELVHEDGALSVVHDRGMANVVGAVVVSHDPEDGVTTLAIARSGSPRATELAAPIMPVDPGSGVMVTIHPWDIALALEPLRGVSIQNQIPGVVTRTSIHERRALVEIDIGAPVIAEITRRSFASMAIEVGRPIYCLIKSHAIRHVGSVDR